MDELVYRKEHRVLMRDCDRFQRLKPSVMLTMFQDGSETLTEGWGVGLGSMIARGAMWVAAKLEYTVFRPPLHEESIVIRARAGRSRASLHPFYCGIEDMEGRTLAEGVSLWVLSDWESRSMLSPRIPKIQLPTSSPADERLPRIPTVTKPETWERTVRRVRFSETDINGHLTNSRYLDWMTDLADGEFHRTHPMKGLRIEYRGEIGPDEEVALNYALSDERLWCEAEGKFAAELLF